MRLKNKKLWLIVAASVILLMVVLSLPPVWSRVSYYSRDTYTRVKYWLNPPAEAVFVPSGGETDPDVATAVAATLTAIAPTPGQVEQPTNTPTASTTQPAISPTPPRPPRPAAACRAGGRRGPPVGT
ncbi:MAG: hypothetical protein AAGU17_04965, partial [Anaerolineaceae bacterium]